jgi:aminoglycoside phosphotransferase family enzyme/predicted kinase
MCPQTTGPVAPHDPGRNLGHDPDLWTLPQALIRPGAFPAPAPTEVSVRSTHASWVFLTDDDVWKVKRPVSYGFLDYSDLERRRHFCEEEVRLGRRLAPDVYQGVVPVHRGGEGLSLVGPGPVVEYAVRMLRLPDADSAATLLRAGRLTPRHLDRLTDRLAAFYADAPSCADLGSPGVLSVLLAENHAQTLPFVGRFVDGSALERLYHWQQGTLAALHPLVCQRVREDKIRDGHGDLRLEHVYFPGGSPDRPIVIDPIEFNRGLRGADVALDAAFLGMELDANEQPSLAAFYLSRFARDTADYELYPLLDLYLSYRAWVRAKVACVVAADPTTAPEKARRKSAEAARLFALAESYTRPWAGDRHVIAVGGLIGTGKSTVADALTLDLRLPAVSSDATRKSLSGLPPTAPGGDWLYTEERTRSTYEELFRRAECVLTSGRGVVLDASFSTVQARAAARDLARRRNRPFLFVEVDCDEATIRERLRARQEGRSVSDAREALLPLFRRRYRAPDELSRAERLTVDGRADPPDTARAVRERLG